MRHYVIGDIHGQLELLKAAHDRIARDDAAHGGGGHVIHVGDLIDRGPNSRGVVEYLMRGQADGQRWTVLKGNHDRFLTQFLREPEWVDPGLTSGLHWLDHQNLGAGPTLASYWVERGTRSHAEVLADARRAVPQAHLDWLQALPLYHRIPGAVVVHAGLRPGVALQDQAEDDLLWIRKGFLDNVQDHGTLVVHGHTVVERVTHFGNRLAVDTGAAYGGPLSVVVFDESGLHEVTDQGRIGVQMERAPA